MKPFLGKLVLFCSLLVVLLGISYRVNAWLFQTDMVQLDPATHTLIAGDSHAVFAFNPRAIPHSVNVAQEGESLMLTFYKIRFLLRGNPQIRNVVISFSPHNLSAFNDRKFADPPWAEQAFDRYYPLVDWHILSERKVAALDYWKSVLRNKVPLNRNYLLNWIKRAMGRGMPQYPFIGEYRFSRSCFLVDIRLDNAIDRHFYHDGELYGISELETAYLERLVNLTRERNRRLILVSVPLHYAYLANIPSLHMKEFRRLQRRLEAVEDVYFADLTRMNLHDSCYFDYDHLNTRGADMLAKALNGILGEAEGGGSPSPVPTASSRN